MHWHHKIVVYIHLHQPVGQQFYDYALGTAIQQAHPITYEKIHAKILKK